MFLSKGGNCKMSDQNVSQRKGNSLYEKEVQQNRQGNSNMPNEVDSRQKDAGKSQDTNASKPTDGLYMQNINMAPPTRHTGGAPYLEETSAEMAPSYSGTGDKGHSGNAGGTKKNAKGLGLTALILSILSLFFMPILLGAAGVAIGIAARINGSKGMAAWAIVIGSISLVIGLMIAPFT